MSERQRRVDCGTAKAVARGVNILAVRNRTLAPTWSTNAFPRVWLCACLTTRRCVACRVRNSWFRRRSRLPPHPKTAT